MPGQPAEGGPNPAAFPRPAGSPEAAEAAAGPPPPFHPANCPPVFMRMTTGAVPNSQALKARWHLPYGAVVHPLAESGGTVPIANLGNSTIIRCKRCRTYMNPHMVWMDGGRCVSVGLGLGGLVWVDSGRWACGGVGCGVAPHDPSHTVRGTGMWGSPP